MTHFRLDFGVVDLSLTPASALSRITYPIVFDYGGLRCHRVEIEPTVREGRSSALGHVFGTYVPNDAAAKYLDSLGPPNNRCDTASSQSVKSFLEMVHKELWDVGSRTARTIRWRTASRGPHNPFWLAGLFASRDAEAWLAVPVEVSIHAEAYGSASLREGQQADVVRLVQAGRDEPAAHQVLREAAEDISQNRRTALLLGFVAAEIGMKALIASRGAEAAWMAWEAPSPPLEKMCRDLLPKMAGFSLPEEMLTTLKKAAQKRNLVVHKEELPPDIDFVHDFIGCVRQLLWLFDVLSGETWATGMLDDNLRKRVLSVKLAPDAGG